MIDKNAIVAGVASLGCAALLVSGFGVPRMNEVIKAYKTEVSRHDATVYNLNSIASTLTASATEFNDARECEIPYTDISRISSYLAGTPGVSVLSTIIVDAREGFAEKGEYSGEGDCNAIKFRISFTDYSLLLKAVETLELPIYSVTADMESQSMEMITLVGGAY